MLPLATQEIIIYRSQVEKMQNDAFMSLIDNYPNVVLWAPVVVLGVVVTFLLINSVVKYCGRNEIRGYRHW